MGHEKRRYEVLFHEKIVEKVAPCSDEMEHFFFLLKNEWFDLTKKGGARKCLENFCIFLLRSFVSFSSEIKSWWFELSEDKWDLVKVDANKLGIWQCNVSVCPIFPASFAQCFISYLSADLWNKKISFYQFFSQAEGDLQRINETLPSKFLNDQLPDCFG